ncbi:MAG TPA: alkaline phosphatase family protein [Dehalococcoidia bacterium]|nr:alkaline phosphatase family protein [Dehalococcoidia bacterium]
MTASQYSRLIFVMIDGANYEVMCDLMARGELPALSALAASGGGLKKAVTCFPSTTGPAYIPYFMGLYPGTANVPGYRWLSRASYNGRGSRWTRPGLASYSGREALGFDLDLPDRPTWFDYFGSHRNVFNMLTKGLDPKDDLTRRSKPLAYGIGHYLHQWRLTDRVAAQSLIQAVKDGPEFIACTFNGVDGHSHEKHPYAPKVIESYRTIDRTIAEARRILKQAGRDEDTLWVIGSDHGQSPTHTHIDVARLLDEMGLPCLYFPRLWRKDAHCAEMVSGNGMTQIYLRGDNDWRDRTPWEEVDARGVPQALLAQDGVDLVAGQTSDGRVKLRTATGEGTIDWRAGFCSYAFTGTDPLGCGAFSKLDDEEVLRLTFDSSRPDACMQLAQIFRAERTGDIVVSAKRGYDLRARWELPEHRSTHGALVPAQMHVPVIISHPIAANNFRTVDVFPTVLQLMDRSPEDGIDGVVRA